MSLNNSHTEQSAATLLGVNPKASLAEIQDAYKRLTMDTHPAQNKGREAAGRNTFFELLGVFQYLKSLRPAETADATAQARPNIPKPGRKPSLAKANDTDRSGQTMPLIRTTHQGLQAGQVSLRTLAKQSTQPSNPSARQRERLVGSASTDDRESRQLTRMEYEPTKTITIRGSIPNPRTRPSNLPRNVPDANKVQPQLIHPGKAPDPTDDPPESKVLERNIETIAKIIEKFGVIRRFLNNTMRMSRDHPSYEKLRLAVQLAQSVQSGLQQAQTKTLDVTEVDEIMKLNAMLYSLDRKLQAAGKDVNEHWTDAQRTGMGRAINAFVDAMQMVLGKTKTSAHGQEWNFGTSFATDQPRRGSGERRRGSGEARRQRSGQGGRRGRGWSRKTVRIDEEKNTVKTIPGRSP